MFDILSVGPFIFSDFAPPSEMPFGGKQELKVHKTPGGGRTVDVMGPDDHDPKWSGFLYGDFAFDDMLTLDALRKAGLELAFQWGAESRTVVISECTFKVEKPTFIHYDITLVYTDDSTTFALPGLSLGGMVGADIAGAFDIGSGL